MIHFLILVLEVCSNAFTRVFIKVDVTEPRKSHSFRHPISTLTNWFFWFGLFLYGTVFLFYAAALLAKFSLDFAHSILTTRSVAIVSLLSFFIFKKSFCWKTAIGIVLIFVVIALIIARVG